MDKNKLCYCIPNFLSLYINASRCVGVLSTIGVLINNNFSYKGMLILCSLY